MTGSAPVAYLTARPTNDKGMRMKAKKTRKSTNSKITSAGTVIQNCSVVGNDAETNEHTRVAVVALANACIGNAEANKRNAEAIIAAAGALKGSPGIAGNGIHIDGAT